MKNLIAFCLSMVSLSAVAQMNHYTVSYDGIPACNTTFTIKDTNGRELAKGKSDALGTFACDFEVNQLEAFILDAEPDKGKGWGLTIPMAVVQSYGMDYDIRIEEIEAWVQAGFEMQNEMVEDSKQMNNQMNEESGSIQGTEELALIGGIVKAGQKIGDAQFKIIKVSIARSCSDVELPKGKKGEDKKEAENPEVKEDKKAEKGEKAEKEEKNKSEKSGNSKKDKKAVEEQAENSKEDKKEAERAEKERLEAERLEQERLEEEAELAAEDLNFTSEELAAMGFIDLNKKKAWCSTAIDRNKLKLKTRSSFLSPEEITAIENRILELETAVMSIDTELDRRAAEKDAKKAEKESEN